MAVGEVSLLKSDLFAFTDVRLGGGSRRGGGTYLAIGEGFLLQSNLLAFTGVGLGCGSLRRGGIYLAIGQRFCRVFEEENKMECEHGM